MDLAFSPEETAFREEIRAWIRDNLPAGWGTPASKNRKRSTSGLSSRAMGEAARRCGWAGISWPKEYGGRGATLMEQIIFHEEMAAARAPQIFINFVGINLAGPTMRPRQRGAEAALPPKDPGHERGRCQGSASRTR